MVDSNVDGGRPGGRDSESAPRGNEVLFVDAHLAWAMCSGGREPQGRYLGGELDCPVEVVKGADRIGDR